MCNLQAQVDGGQENTNRDPVHSAIDAGWLEDVRYLVNPFTQCVIVQIDRSPGDQEVAHEEYEVQEELDEVILGKGAQRRRDGTDDEHESGSYPGRYLERCEWLDHRHRRHERAIEVLAYYLI